MNIAIAVLAIGATALAVGAATADGAPSLTSSAGAPSLAPGDPPIAPPPADALAGMAEFDVTYEPVAINASRVGSRSETISVTYATATARQGSGIGAGGKATTASLGRVTLGQYGTELQKDPNKPSTIDPFIEDRVVWVITFERAPIQIHGPLAAEGQAFVEQPLVAFIDPTTGEFLAAISYG